MPSPPTPLGGSWKRVAQLTADALERPASERAAWLVNACGGDETLRQEVESLLVADASAGGFLERAAIASDGAAEAIAAAARESLGLVAGRRIGPYQIVRELGHGGMGVVYLARRADLAFEKDVAIKVVRGGMGTELALQRFRDERHILATLDHPNIARLLDGGVTPEGLSYFVMEYVDGVALDAYCDTARLTLTQRLHLFGQVCAAVQYAHRRLVIHRDIKSRNILVTAEGTPKLLDFGIARLLDQNLTEGQTRTGQRAFTLENASPEQIRGEPMAVTSDVYALGVLLYHLITGQRPCGTTATTDADLMQAICNEPPVRPALATRSGTGFTVSVELEWVVLKALRKEPDRRYESVEQFADDIRRLLSARPVIAAPDSRRYRARKFVTRHRTAVAATALVTLSLVAGLATTLWQARRANQERARAEQRLQSSRRLANAMVFELNDALESGPTTARALLLTRASEQLDALARDSPDDPVLAEELATAYHRLADVQSQTRGANLGETVGSRANHLKGLAIRKSLAAQSPTDLEATLRLGQSLIAVAYAEDEIGPALEYANAAVGSAESLVATRPEERRFRHHLARAHYALGSQYRAVGDNVRALASFEAATPLFEAVYDADTKNAAVRMELALCYKRLGAILNDQSRFTQALDHLRKAVDLDQTNLTESPASTDRRRDLSVSQTQLGFALSRSGDPERALVAYERAKILREELVGEDPKNNRAIRDLATALWYIGVAENQLGRHATAAESFQRALPLSVQSTRGSDPFSISIVSGLAEAHEGRGQLSDALRLRRQAVDQYRVLLAGQPKSKTFLRGVMREESLLGGTFRKLADREPGLRAKWSREACSVYAAAMARSAGLAEGTPEPVDVGRRDELRRALEGCTQGTGHGR